MSALSNLPKQARDVAVTLAQTTPWPAEEWAITLAYLLAKDPAGSVKLEQIIQATNSTGQAPTEVAEALVQTAQAFAEHALTHDPKTGQPYFDPQAFDALLKTL